MPVSDLMLTFPSKEILDFGYPQNTETDTLKMYITTEGVKSERTMVIAFIVGLRQIIEDLLMSPVGG